MAKHLPDAECDKREKQFRGTCSHGLLCSCERERVDCVRETIRPGKTVAASASEWEQSDQIDGSKL